MNQKQLVKLEGKSEKKNNVVINDGGNLKNLNLIARETHTIKLIFQEIKIPNGNTLFESSQN